MLIHAKEYWDVLSVYITTTLQHITVFSSQGRVSLFGTPWNKIHKIGYDRIKDSNLKPVDVVREGKNGKRHKKARLGKFVSERGLWKFYLIKGVVNCKNSRDKGPPKGNSARG